MRVLLIDGLNLIRRIFEADARPIEDVMVACVNSVKRALAEHDPTHAICVMDRSVPTFRHTIYPEYKAGRTPAPAALTEALPAFEDRFLDLGVRSLFAPGFEADDIIATVAVAIADAGEARILSTDRTFQQLLSDRVRVFDHFRRGEVTASDVQDKHGVAVAALVDFWSLTGDSSNNIRGVRGIGPKRAALLLERYGDLASILSSGDSDAVRVREGAAEAMLATRLVRLKTDVPLGTNLREFRLQR